MNTRNTLFRLLAAGLITGLLFGAGISPAALAVTDNTSGQESITLSPTKRQYKFDPGTVIADELTIINDGQIDYEFRVYAKPYSVTGETYEPDFYTTKTNTDIEAWVKFEKTSYLLKAGQNTKVAFTIHVPKDAIPGGHYGVIFAETQPASAVQGTSVERKKRVGTLLYATVNGDYEMGGAFDGIKTDTVQFKPPLRSELKVENTGSSDFAVETVFAVSDVFGNRKFTDEKSLLILPKTKRQINLTWDKSPGFGLYQVTTSAKFLDQETTRTAYVLMAPIAFYMVFIIGLFAGIIYLVQKRR